MQKKPGFPVDAIELRHRAETRLKAQAEYAHSAPPQTEADARRLLHEVQVHQLELEMQNAELHEARNSVETLLETYTDLYDFAPIGYFSVDEEGLILEVNLVGAALLGIERSRLINRRLQGFVAPASQTTFPSFFKKVFSGPEKQICEISFLNERGTPFWADVQAASASFLRGERKWCRMAISDLTTLKQAEEVRIRLEAMAVANQKLTREIVQRHKVEEALKKSEAHYAHLFEESRHMQEQLRHLSRQLLLTQEEERKRISRELHDEIVQTLVSINVHLAALTMKSPFNIKDLKKNSSRRNASWKNR